MGKYNVTPRTLFEHPTTVGMGRWEHGGKASAGNRPAAGSVARKPNEAGSRGQSTCPVPAPFIVEPDDISLYSTKAEEAALRLDNTAVLVQRSNKLKLTEEAFKEVDGDLQNLVIESQVASQQDIASIDQAGIRAKKINLKELTITQLVMDYINKLRSPTNRPLQLAADVSTCPLAPRKPSRKELQTTTCMLLLSPALGRKSVATKAGLEVMGILKQEPALENDGMEVLRGPIAKGTAIAATPSFLGAGAQTIRVAREEETKKITLHLKHMLLSTLTKDVGELVLLRYEKLVDRFCHDAGVRFLQQRAHSQEHLGLQILQGTQCEEFSELVMRRWVLLVRLLERKEKSSKVEGVVERSPDVGLKQQARVKKDCGSKIKCVVRMGGKVLQRNEGIFDLDKVREIIGGREPKEMVDIHKGINIKQDTAEEPEVDRKSSWGVKEPAEVQRNANTQERQDIQKKRKLRKKWKLRKQRKLKEDWWWF